MAEHDVQINDLDKKITALSNALAHLGKGTSLQELLRIIRFPGYTTPAEILFTGALVDAMQAQVSTITQLENNLLAAAKAVVAKTKTAGA